MENQVDTFAVTLTDQSGSTTQLDAPNMITALIVADINLGEGEAEIRRGSKCLARLRKASRGPGGFWRVNP